MKLFGAFSVACWCQQLHWVNSTSQQVNASVVWEGQESPSPEKKSLINKNISLWVLIPVRLVWVVPAFAQRAICFAVIRVCSAQLAHPLTCTALLPLWCWITLQIHLPPTECHNKCLLLFPNVIQPAFLLDILSAAVLKDATTLFYILDWNSLLPTFLHLGLLIRESWTLIIWCKWHFSFCWIFQQDHKENVSIALNINKIILKEIRRCEIDEALKA